MKKTIFLIFLALLLAGCALNIRTTGYWDQTSGISTLPRGATFAVLDNASAPNPIFDREIKGKIEKLIARKGYRIEAPEKAEYYLSFGYSIQPGLRSGTVTTFGPPQTQISRVPDGRGGVTTQAIMVPGSSSAVPVITAEYTRQVTLKVADAVSAREGRKENVVWIGESSSMDPSSDLRSDIDYLLVATFLFFGRDTGKQVQVRMSKDHPDVRELRRERGLLQE